MKSAVFCFVGVVLCSYVVAAVNSGYVNTVSGRNSYTHSNNAPATHQSNTYHPNSYHGNGYKQNSYQNSGYTQNGYYGNGNYYGNNGYYFNPYGYESFPSFQGFYGNPWYANQRYHNSHPGYGYNGQHLHPTMHVPVLTAVPNMYAFPTFGYKYHGVPYGGYGYQNYWHTHPIRVGHRFNHPQTPFYFGDPHFFERLLRNWWPLLLLVPLLLFRS